MDPKVASPEAPRERLSACSADDLKDAKRAIKPAGFVDSFMYNEKGYSINEMRFSTPLEHRGYHREEHITVTVRAVIRNAQGEAGDTAPRACPIQVTPDKPIAAYLCGGPGSDNPPTACTAITQFYLDKGFQILYMDYRGTGASHELRADVLSPVFAHVKIASSDRPRLAGLTPDEQAAYLSHFRQDNIVRDLEAVRRRLSLHLGLGEQPAGEDQKLKLTLVGQSYGGWITHSYLSFFPESLDMVLITGGIPPVGQTAEKVYRNTFKTTLAANNAFYCKYPTHVEIAKRVVKWVEDNSTGGWTIPMPGGGNLTRARFLCLGRTLGTTGGDEKVKKSLDMCLKDISESGRLSWETLVDIEGWIRFEERPLYAILQEPIYTEPHLPPSRWAAQGVAETLLEYAWLSETEIAEDAWPSDRTLPGERVTFYAEHVFPFHYDQFQALRPLKQAADILASKTDWPPLFDLQQLARNRVPIAGLSYTRDIFIDWELAEITVGHTANIVHEARSDLMHTAVKDRTEITCPRLWTLLGDAVTKAKGLKVDEVSAEDRASAVSLLAVLHK